MALTTATFTRRFNLHRIVVGLTLAGVFLAVLPIAAAVIGDLIGAGGSRTAFASATQGDYAVYSRAGVSTDEILVANAKDASTAMSIATIDHLDGFPARGAVSPNGKQLALINVDAGTPAQPGASLLVLDLESGDLTRAAIAVDHLQTPVWTPDGSGVVVTRGGDTAPGTITVVQANADASGETELLRSAEALGLFPVAYNPEGQLISVLLDSRGSTLLIDGSEQHTFSGEITRDWALSPDGAQLAYVETSLSDGESYVARVTPVGAGAAATAQTLADAPSALGVAWNPSSNEPHFGLAPGSTTARPGVLAQSIGGFDIPLQYTADGEAVAIVHWSGSSFDSPGEGNIEVVTGEGRSTLSGATEFFGWAAR